jgi:hypothetical protein
MIFTSKVSLDGTTNTDDKSGREGRKAMAGKDIREWGGISLPISLKKSNDHQEGHNGDLFVSALVQNKL